ncbi:MAG: STT3 domain-containing protein [Candidatus Omnitrophota bacterium]
MKKNAILFIWLGLLLFINIYFRLFPAYFPRLKKEAADIVQARIRQEVSTSVNKKFPQFSPLAKEELLRAYTADYNKNNAALVREETGRRYKELKSAFQDNKGQTFLMELDCWNWARYVENVLLHGYPGDLLKDGKSLDMLMLAPFGSYIGWNNFLYYASAYLYKVFRVFKPVPLFTFLFYLPVLFLAIFIITLFFFCYRWGIIASVIACVFVGLSPVFIVRSSAGWFDTDILNLLFPLCIVWAYLKAGEVLHLRQKIYWIFISSFLTGLFCFTWPHWWFIFLIIIIYEIYSIVNARLLSIMTRDSLHMGSLRQHAQNALLFFLLSIFWILILCGSQPLSAVFSQVKNAFFLNKTLIDSPWPNVYSTVAELRKPDFNYLAYQGGGPILFILSLGCVITLYLRLLRRQFSGFSAEAINILVFWFLAMLFACFKGVRFAVFLIVPLGICLGWQLSDIYEYSLRQKMRLLTAVSVIVITIIIAGITKNAFSTAYNISPMIDNTWYKSLIFMRQASPPEAIINSWWDFGDWFKVIARRRVIFDGQSQTTPQAYWMANVLLSGNEEESLAILRMLNNGGNRAFDIISADLKDPFKAAIILEKVITLDRKSAEAVLSASIPSRDKNEVLRIVFDRPAKAYFVVDPNTQRVISPVSVLGNWDFLKVYVARNLYKENKGKIISELIRLGIKRQDAGSLYTEAAMVPQGNLDEWVTRQVRFYTESGKGDKKNDLVLFENKVVYNIKDNTVYLFSDKDQRYKIPKSLFLLDRGALKEISFLNSDSPASVLVFKEGSELKAVLLPAELARSMFVRLYFLKGEGLKHFKPFIDTKDDTGYIRIFEIIWD